MVEFPQDHDNSLFSAAFDALPDAACILEPMLGPDGKPMDWRYLAANHRIGELLDLRGVAGQTLRSRWPLMAQQWLGEFSQVLTTGKPLIVTRPGFESSLIYETTLTPVQFGDRGAVMAILRDVSAEHKARTQRREADERYKRLFDAIDEGFCIIEVMFDGDGTATDYLFLEGNEAFVKHSGLIDPIGKSMRSLEPDIEDQWPETYGRIAMTGVAERFEDESPALSRWFDVFAFPIGDKAPYLVGVLFENIGARKSMELALRHSESRLQSLIDATSDLIFRMNPDGTLVQQVGGRRLLGDVSNGREWVQDFIPESDQADVLGAIAEAIEQRAPLEIEHRVRTADGAIIWIHSRAVPVLGDDGAITEWFGMATDITNRRQTEQQLAHGAQMLRVASEIGKVGLWDWDVETDELIWSDEHYRMEGYEPGEVAPTYGIWAERVHPADLANAEVKIAHAMESGEDYVNEYRVRRPDGEIVWLSARGRFLYDEKSQPVRMLGAVIDTTQRRREEEWQKLLVAELQHRVRNLIGMVRSVARLSAPSHRHVDDYVDHLIGRLQAMGRTQSTLTRSPGRSVDLAELVREELLVHAVQEDKCHVDGPEVWLSPHAAEIVTLAIHELATNSIKYGALGDTGYIRIVWATEEKDGKPWVSLRWQETAPLRKIKQTRRGFGRKLIEERVPYELHGEGRFALHDTGVLAELEFPLSDAGSILDTRS